ncbi:unnamed protein product [Caenorhabditis bovis]|uniref:Protein amnionless n=1 Tax=Caenorhabditis bovis TaxID=2654633 RepID=A0A8S1EBT5_9PELO|nr:unnamed protein product [Caenorhabditis bovis]
MLLLVVGLFIHFFSEDTEAAKFTYSPNLSMSNRNNWQNSDVPCKGDHVRFEDTKYISAYLNDAIMFDSMLLPSNGVIYLDEKTKIGIPANWQCERRKSAEDVFFSPEDRFPSFFNPQTWKSDDNSFLHMNQIPSELDDVEIPKQSSFQLYLDLPVKINRMKLHEREVCVLI